MVLLTGLSKLFRELAGGALRAQECDKQYAEVVRRER